MNFSQMTDTEIRQFAGSIAADAMQTKGHLGFTANYAANSAALWADNGKVGMLRRCNFGAVDFEPMADIPKEAATRLRQANSCFSW